jgi:long-chain acyl-CoA synthetase
VIVSGFNVYPVEVEDVIREVDVVSEAAVIGVEDPVMSSGRRVRHPLMVRTPPPWRTPREHCAVRLARFKQPSRIEVVDHALTVTGKVQKGRLRVWRPARARPAGMRS